MKKTAMVPEDGRCPHYGGETEVVCCCECRHYISITFSGAPSFAICSYAEPKTALQAIYSLAKAK